jgi:selT/selW/selH-like putative selenoprotein
LAAVIQRKLKTQPKLIEGKGGVFDVKMDGQTIYSKHETGRFPEDSEIIDALTARHP